MVILILTITKSTKNEVTARAPTKTIPPIRKYELKALSLMISGALVMMFVVPVMAYHRRSSDDTSVRNYGRVTNNVEVKADSGDNSISGKYVGGGRILTGIADAMSTLVNVVNTNDLGCGCDGDLSVKNMARVRNNVEVKADSGDNSISGKYVRRGMIGTGDAIATSVIESTVNTTVTGD
ncbi:MAG: hypothetical protein QY322_01935 [bacterium]|nr:MAG: hypothetical protein QY322_01935 [bacterium]